MNTVAEKLRFPIGHYVLPDGALLPAARAALIGQLEALPAALKAAAQAAGGVQLEQPYRPGGWSGRQVIHHLADSHLNCYTRFRLALTEENPTIRPYDEGAWAELPDVAATPVTVSLALLGALHTRWTILLHHFSEVQWARTFYHPGTGRTLSLDQALAMYAWHGQHHLAHLQMLILKD